MIEVLRAAEMRAIEQAAIASGRVTGQDLMERAGRGVVDAVCAEWPGFRAAPHRAVVLCGPGNNGGDGFVVARLLKERGWDVEVFLYGDPGRLPPDAQANYRRLGPGIACHRLTQPQPSKAEMRAFEDAASHIRDLQQKPDDADLPPFLLVDGLFGIGLSRGLTGLDDLVRHWDYLANFRDLNKSRIVAIDVPSGMDSDTGEIVVCKDMAFTGVLPADLTVTFHKLKPGHGAGAGPRLGGKVVVADIGLADWDSAAGDRHVS